MSSESVYTQDSELLLQKHRLYRRPMVVPDILCLEFELVSVLTFHQAIASS